MSLADISGDHQEICIASSSKGPRVNKDVARTSLPCWIRLLAPLLVSMTLLPVAVVPAHGDTPQRMILRRNLELSPNRCEGKSNNPHPSRSERGIIKGLTEIKCEGQEVLSLRTTAQLWRRRWWGFEKVGQPGENINTSVDWGGNDPFVKATARFPGCETNTWRVSGQHWSVEGNGDKTYHGATAKRMFIRCGPGPCHTSSSSRCRATQTVKP